MEKFFLDLGKMVLGLGIALVIFGVSRYSHPVQSLDQFYETKAYEAIEIFNGKTFNELKDEEDFYQEIKVFPSVKYPGDKQVIISYKHQAIKTVLFIENDNGVAKVVDVIVNGNRIVFK